ncbi:hypothetical protein DL98DRAFT_648201 [Cadophora sp. DSE1049]|nr:hypothetical protein DL98DRAFT_648201 [Cadophora sp. DSE1049]
MSPNAALHCTASHRTAPTSLSTIVTYLRTNILPIPARVPPFPSPQDYLLRREPSGPAKRSLQPNHQGISQDSRPSQNSRKLRQRPDRKGYPLGRRAERSAGLWQGW